MSEQEQEVKACQQLILEAMACLNSAVDCLELGTYDTEGDRYELHAGVMVLACYELAALADALPGESRGLPDFELEPLAEIASLRRELVLGAYGTRALPKAE